jgi:hypothetical protein
MNTCSAVSFTTWWQDAECREDREMSCLSTTSLGAQWFYPVVDPYRTAGPGGPWAFGYNFAWDGVVVRVSRNPSLSRCQMRVELSSTLPRPKQIQAFNFHNDAWVDHIDSDPTGAVPAMTIERRRPGQGCGVGTDTVVVARAGWLGPKAFYTFPPDDFWDFWGGCTVAFEWQEDRNYPHERPLGPSGAHTPQPRYPIVQLPDRTLMRNEAGTSPGFRVVFGGTDFAVDDSIVINGLRYLDAFDPLASVPFRSVPSLPVDGTLVREWQRPEVYVVYGGARFQIPDPPSRFDPGFDWARVGVLPPGPRSLGKLLHVPVDGTLVREQHDLSVFLVDKRQLRRVKSWAVMDARCLPWRHVRVVPDGALAALPRGADLTLKDGDVSLQPPPLDPNLPTVGPGRVSPGPL